jgi:hypothetical protein
MMLVPRLLVLTGVLLVGLGARETHIHIGQGAC